jgi:hypothetical protein
VTCHTGYPGLLNGGKLVQKSDELVAGSAGLFLLTRHGFALDAANYTGNRITVNGAEGDTLRTCKRMRWAVALPKDRRAQLTSNHPDRAKTRRWRDRQESMMI